MEGLSKGTSLVMIPWSKDLSESEESLTRGKAGNDKEVTVANRGGEWKDGMGPKELQVLIGRLSLCGLEF